MPVLKVDYTIGSEGEDTSKKDHRSALNYLCWILDFMQILPKHSFLGGDDGRTFWTD